MTLSYIFICLILIWLGAQFMIAHRWFLRDAPTQGAVFIHPMPWSDIAGTYRKVVIGFSSIYVLANVVGTTAISIHGYNYNGTGLYELFCGSFESTAAEMLLLCCLLVAGGLFAQGAMVNFITGRNKYWLPIPLWGIGFPGTGYLLQNYLSYKLLKGRFDYIIYFVLLLALVGAGAYYLWYSLRLLREKRFV